MLFSNRMRGRVDVSTQSEVGCGLLSSAKRDYVKTINFSFGTASLSVPSFYYPSERPSFVRSQIRIRTAANDRHACTSRRLKSPISAKFKLLMRNTVKGNTNNLSFQLPLPSSRKRIYAESRLVRRILVAVGGIRVIKNSCETPD
jgi:hypothetical protein